VLDAFKAVRLITVDGDRAGWKANAGDTAYEETCIRHSS
jgi:hypothetical protein